MPRDTFSRNCTLANTVSVCRAIAGAARFHLMREHRLGLRKFESMSKRTVSHLSGVRRSLLFRAALGFIRDPIKKQEAERSCC